MKKILITLAGLFATALAHAQTTQGYFYGLDALKFNNYQNLGTARSAGMGGAFTALGGDLASAVINPAGLGFYNRNEFSISPLFMNGSSNASYLDNSTSINFNSSAIGQAGLVLSKRGTGSRKVKRTFALSYNQLANFQNQYEFQGINNVSSVQDFFAQEATIRNASPEILNNEFNVETGVAFSPEAFYFQAFTIEPVQGGYTVFEPSFPVDQLASVTERGSLNQITLSHANNFDNKTYVGFNIGIQTLNYDQTSFIDEVFPEAVFLRGLRSTDELVANGSGINLGAGIIYQLNKDINIGASVTSPTLMGIRETSFSTIGIDPVDGEIQTDFPVVTLAPTDFEYRITSPLRANVGLAYFLPKKLGVLSADLGYVGYRGIKLRSNVAGAPWENDQNSAIGQGFRDVISVRLGSEFRLGIARLRAGFTQSGAAQNFNDGINRSITTLNFGAGARFKRFFIDFAVNSFSTSFAYSPYELIDTTAFASAAIDSRRTQAFFTVGSHF